MAEITQTSPAAQASQARAAEAAASARPAPSSAAPQASGVSQAGAVSLAGVSLVDAAASLSAGRSLVADYVMGSNNQLAQIRVIDPTTHQVIAESPPDSIARMQQEVLAYQGVASQSRAAAADV